MKMAKKILALLLCAVLLIGASVAGTLAYLTDTKAVTNTFTVGKVEIKLEEAGATERDDKTVGLDLHLVPNVPVNKKPVVTVLKDSEDCYVRVKVTVDVSDSWYGEAASAVEAAGFTFNAWATRFAENYLIYGSVNGFNEEAWEVFASDVDSNAKTVTYILYYIDDSGSNIVSKNTDENTVLDAVFDKVVAPANLTNDQLALLAGMKIKVEAHAIQAGGFANATAAWLEFDSTP